MNNKKVIIPLVITGVNLYSYLMPILALPLLATPAFDLPALTIVGIIAFIANFLGGMLLMFIAPISQFILTFVAVFNRKWWLIIIHVLLLVPMIVANYMFFDWFFHISV